MRVEGQQPADLKTAFTFAALYVVVLFAVAYAKERAGTRGLYLVSALSGLTDVDAITLSVARLVGSQQIDPAQGWRLIVVGLLSNLVFKGAMAAVLGDRRLRRWILLLFGLQLLAGGGRARVLAFLTRGLRPSTLKRFEPGVSPVHRFDARRIRARSAAGMSTNFSPQPGGKRSALGAAALEGRRGAPHDLRPGAHGARVPGKPQAHVDGGVQRGMSVLHHEIQVRPRSRSRRCLLEGCRFRRSRTRSARTMRCARCPRDRRRPAVSAWAVGKPGTVRHYTVIE